MALKRKFEVEVESSVASSHRPMKQLRVASVQTPAAQSEDITMDDASFEPLSASASSLDSDSSEYPAFNLYPFPSYGSSDVDMGAVNQTYNMTSSESRTSSNVSEENKPSVGLMQPRTSFVHNV